MRFRTPYVVVLACSLLSGDLARADETTPSSSPIARIRTSSVVLAALIREATARSTTFRGLVQRIEKSDGIVYIEQGECGGGVRACLRAVTVAGANRVLQVRVSTNREASDLMGAIGHELQHVVEVLGNPRVTSTSAMYFFYWREGLRRSYGFETAAAVRAGDEVRSQVRRPVILALSR